MRLSTSNKCATLSLSHQGRFAGDEGSSLKGPALEDLDDGKLVSLAATGNARAFEMLVRRYQKLVYNVIFQMVQQHETCADLTQETFLRAFRALSGFKRDSSFKPWLLRIASNVTLNYIRDSRGRNFDSLEALLDDHPASEPGSRMDVEEEVDLRFSQAMLARALASLPERHRQVFVLRYQHDLSYSEISFVVGEPETTVKSLLFRVRERLRKMLGQAGHKAE